MDTSPEHVITYADNVAEADVRIQEEEDRRRHVRNHEMDLGTQDNISDADSNRSEEDDDLDREGFGDNDDDDDPESSAFHFKYRRSG